MENVLTGVKHETYRLRRGKYLCPICGNPKDLPRYNYCRLCRNAYQRAKRPKYRDLSPLQRRRNIARSYAKVLKKRGKILADICFACGSRKDIELHHPDIDNRPFDVIPLCRKCHTFIKPAVLESLEKKFDQGLFRSQVCKVPSP